MNFYSKKLNSLLKLKLIFSVLKQNGWNVLQYRRLYDSLLFPSKKRRKNELSLNLHESL